MNEETEVVTVGEPDIQTEVHQEDNSESRARRLGWVPQEEWRGEKGKWVDADSFLERGDKIGPIHRENLTKLERKILELEGKLSEKDQVLNEVSDFYKKTEERAYQRAKDELLKERKEAIERGDGDSFQKAEDSIRELEEQRTKKEKKAEEKPKIDPVLIQWKEKNNWYGENTRLTALADAIGIELRKSGNILTGMDFLDEVTSRLKKEVPQYFRQNGAQSVEGSSFSTRETGSKKKSFDSMPNEAKEQFERFKRNGIKVDKDKFAKDYWEQF